MVIVGAQAVVESGGCINTVGTLQLAIVAQSANTPFYVAAESYKLSRVGALTARARALTSTRTAVSPLAEGRPPDGPRQAGLGLHPTPVHHPALHGHRRAHARCRERGATQALPVTRKGRGVLETMSLAQAECTRGRAQAVRPRRCGVGPAPHSPPGLECTPAPPRSSSTCAPSCAPRSAPRCSLCPRSDRVPQRVDRAQTHPQCTR